MSSNRFSTLLGYSNIVTSLVQETWLGAADCTYVVMGLWNYCGLVPKLHPLTRRNGFTRPFLLVRGWRGDFIHQTVSPRKRMKRWLHSPDRFLLRGTCGLGTRLILLSGLVFGFLSSCVYLGRLELVKRFCTSRTVLLALLVGCGLQLFQQFGGINTVMWVCCQCGCGQVMWLLVWVW